MTAKARNSFKKILSHEINRFQGRFIGLTALCILYSFIKILEIIPKYKDFKGFSQGAIVNSNNSFYYQNHLEEVFANFNNNFMSLKVVIGFIIIGICIYLMLCEFSFKNKSGYMLLILPIKRWKILLSKMIVPILFYIVNYFIGIIIGIFGIVVISNTFTGKYKEHLINNFVRSMDFFHIDNFISSFISIISIISITYFCLMMYKSYGKLATAITMVIFFSGFLFFIFSFILTVIIAETEIKLVVLFSIISISNVLLNVASFKMFKNKIEV